MKNVAAVGAVMLVWGCTSAPSAPGIDGDAGRSVDAGVHLPGDTGPAIDAGLARPDSGIVPGVVDAGYPGTTPPPVDGAPCDEACAGTRCMDDCLTVCRLAGPALPEDRRPSFFECVRQNTCDIEDQCLDNPPSAPAACERVCALRVRDLDACGVDFFDAGEHCTWLCSSTLARMSPAAQQAFQNCLDEGCGVDQSIDCDPEQFYGPTPSQTCIDYARSHAHCAEDDEHWWSAVWDCETMRSPAGQEGLGGNDLVTCLADNPACGDMGFFGCMVEMERETGRADAIRLACANAARCDDDMAGGCRFYMSGITPLMGTEAVRLLGECLERAGDRCDSIEQCIEAVFEPGQADGPSTCTEGCQRCGQVDESCVNLCLRLGNSLSVEQAADYRECLASGACGDLLPEACMAQVLPWVGEACSSFVETMHDLCPETRNYPGAFVRAFCSISGLRTGAFGPAELVDCARRVGCTGNPVELCLRGIPQ
jgi:hypothetical protein